MDNFIITTAGRRVELQPVNQRFIQKAVASVEKDFRARGEPLDPPWYWSIEPGPDGQGGEKTQWDSASVAKDGTPEEKEAWAKHQDAAERLEEAQKAKSSEIMLLRGIKNEEDRTPTPAWVKDQESWGVELPSDPRELALEYIQDQIFITPGDLIKAIGKVVMMNLEGTVSDEEVRTVEGSFRHAVAEAAGLEIRQRLGPAPARNGSGAGKVGSVGVQPEKAGSEGSAVLGDKLAE